MVNRIKLVLEQPEYSALLREALREMRTPDAQAHYIVRQELKRMGYQVNGRDKASTSRERKS